jgi:hypothetical protein
MRVLHHWGGHTLLEDDVGFLPALLDIAAANFEMGRQVASPWILMDSGFIASSGSKMAGSGWYSTLISRKASSAASHDSAATAATASP